MEKQTIHLNGIKFEYSEPEGDGIQRIAGYVCKWNETNANGWNIAPGAFDASLSAFSDDGLKPRLDYEHDFAAVIGGIDSLEDDGKGLKVTAHLNTEVALVRDTVLPLMKSGDLRYFSSEFIADDAQWDDDLEAVRVNAATLVGVAVVSLPADPGAAAWLAAYKPKKKTEERDRASDNESINQNSTEMTKKELKKRADDLKVKVNGLEGADEATKRDIVSQLESLLDLVTDETSDTAADEIANKLEAIRDLVEAVSEKTRAEETAAAENAAKASEVETNHYLKSQQSVKDFCNVIRNSHNRDEMQRKWQEKLAENSITITAGSESAFLPELVRGYIQDAWDRNDNWLRRLRNTGAKRYAARVNSSTQDAETSRAKGHKKGETKVSEELTFAAKIFSTQFIYKLMTIDKQTEYESDEALLRYIADELPTQIYYEIRRAILVGDGRAVSSPYKVTSLEAIARAATDSYVTVGTYDNTKELVDQIVDGIADIRKSSRRYLAAFMTTADLNKLRRVLYATGGTPEYRPVQYVADMLGVDEIVETDLLSDTSGDNRIIVADLEKYATVGDMMNVSFVNWEKYETNELNWRAEVPVGGGIEGLKAAYVMVMP